MFRYLYHFAMILLFYSFDLSLSAQETYVLEDDLVSKDDSIKVYKFDFFDENHKPELICSIDGKRFLIPPDTLASIGQFQFSADRTQIYFVESDRGDLFKYTIADDKLELLIDLLPGDINDCSCAEIADLIWENDSTLYFSGGSYGRYNINTGELQNIFNIINWDDYFENQDFWANGMTKYKDIYIYKSLKGNLMQLDLDNPKNSKLLYPYEEDFYYYTQFVFYEFDCDSSALYAIDFFKQGECKINMETYDYYPAEEIYGIFYHDEFFAPTFVHYNKKEFEDCKRIIDLDMDDSTVGGNDFLIDELCNHTGIPVSDTDVKINNVWALDSITIKIKNASSEQYIGVPDGNYDIIRSNTADIALVNNGSTTNEELQKAIIDAMYFNTGEQKYPNIEVQFLAWYDGVSGDTARAYLKMLKQFPQAGEDIYKEYCKEDDVIDLYSLLDSEVSTSGDFVDTDFNKIGGELDISKEGIFKGFYIVGVEECSDTALLEIVVNDIPDILPVKDTSMCYGSTYKVDLSYINSDIEWSDGVKDKVRVIEITGDYIYKVTDDHGCYASDTFLVFVSEQPTITPIEATVCEGEPFYFLGKEYNEVGKYADTLKDVNGCDSAYFYINLAYFERSEIVLTGNMGFCEGESTTLTIESEHRDLKLDGQDIKNTIEISEPGSYVLTGYDKNKCPSELRFEVSAYPNPQIFAENIVDAEFSEPIKMPVDYSEGVVSYAWTPLSGLDCYDCPFPNIMSAKDMMYKVQVTDKNGCVSTQDISVSFKKIEYDIPNAIFNKPVHPNNGVLYVKSNLEFYYNLEIYDRWGNVLYRAENIRSNDPDGGWSPQGEVNSGVFVYKVELKEYGKKKVIVGDVTVL